MSPCELFKTDRLLFRAAENTDEDKVFLQQQILNDPVIQMMSTLRLAKPLQKGTADEFIKTLQDNLLGVIICLHAKGDHTKPIPIGHLGIFDHHGSGLAHHRSAMLGVSLADGYRGKGYGSEAINWALDWAFQHAGLHSIRLGTFSYNHDALKAYRKVGFVEEGREREAIYHLRAWHDIVTFSMLEHEWEKLRGITKA